MTHLTDCHDYRYSARDRKATKRRDRRLREKRNRPRHKLQADRTRALTIGVWTISRYGELGFLFEEIAEKMRTFLLDRKIDQDRKRSALRTLASMEQLEIERLSKQGAIIRWTKPSADETFEVHIREEDCLNIDHQQWRFERSDEENSIISSLLVAYEGIHRTQIEKLLDTGKVEYESSLLGRVRILLRGGHLHTKYLKPLATDFELSLLNFAEAA